jgi:hypothetical protein
VEQNGTYLAFIWDCGITRKNLSQDSRCLDHNLNSGPHAYEGAAKKHLYFVRKEVQSTVTADFNFCPKYFNIVTY